FRRPTDRTNLAAAPSSVLTLGLRRRNEIRMSFLPQRRVVVTGLGVVSPNGVGRELFLEANRNGTSGVRRIVEFDTSALKSQVAGMIRGLALSAAMERRQLRRVSRMVPLAITAAREALNDAGLAADRLDLPTRRQIGVLLGSGGGGAEYVEAMYAH